MPFRPAVFDGITTGETLEHLDGDAAAVQEIGRVLPSGAPASQPSALCSPSVPHASPTRVRPALPAEVAAWPRQAAACPA